MTGGLGEDITYVQQCTMLPRELLITSYHVIPLSFVRSGETQMRSTPPHPPPCSAIISKFHYRLGRTNPNQTHVPSCHRVGISSHSAVVISCDSLGHWQGDDRRARAAHCRWLLQWFWCPWCMEHRSGRICASACLTKKKFKGNLKHTKLHIVSHL